MFVPRQDAVVEILRCAQDDNVSLICLKHNGRNSNTGGNGRFSARAGGSDATKSWEWTASEGGPYKGS
jgi:hypothetical protein